MTTLALVSAVPECSLKRWLYAKAYVSSFRILARSLTCLVQVHNEQYRAPGGSICVANHTTPYDVVVLSIDNNYSLVSRSIKSRVASRLLFVILSISMSVWFCRFGG